MRLVLLAAVALGAWLFLRARRDEHGRVLVGWADGSELELRPGTPGWERLTAIAKGASR